MSNFNVKTAAAKAASSIIAALREFAKASDKLGARVTLAAQGLIDAAYAGGFERNEANTKALQKAFLESDAIVKAVALGGLERKSATEYAQSIARAFFHNVPYAPGLKNDPSMALPWGKAKAKESAKAGKVESTDRAALDATLGKALKQARLLGLTEFAATLLDHCLESLEGFKETKDEPAPM